MEIKTTKQIIHDYGSFVELLGGYGFGTNNNDKWVSVESFITILKLLKTDMSYNVDEQIEIIIKELKGDE